jgi:hypothetical protein
MVRNPEPEKTKKGAGIILGRSQWFSHRTCHPEGVLRSNKHHLLNVSHDKQAATQNHSQDVYNHEPRPALRNSSPKSCLSSQLPSLKSQHARIRTCLHTHMLTNTVSCKAARPLHQHAQRSDRDDCFSRSGYNQ